MKIAVAVENNLVSQHFGHCEGFKIYTIDNNSVKEEKFIQNPGHQKGLLPKILGEEKVNAVIAGGMGAMAQDLFKQNGIDVYVGVSGSADDVSKLLAEGKLDSKGGVCDNHTFRGTFKGQCE